MTRNLFAFVAGGLFGLGLLVSGMTNTVKVQGWLDFFGNWDPTLAFVMGGAILPMTFAWAISRRREASALGGQFPPSTDSVVDFDLVAGSVLFGAGWALAGLCPGPAIASISFGGVGGAVFLLAMIVGMRIAPIFKNRLRVGANRKTA